MARSSNPPSCSSSARGGYTLAGTYNRSAPKDSHFRGGWRPAQTDPEYGRLSAATTGELDQSRVLGRAARRYMAQNPLYVAEVGYCNTLRLAFLGLAFLGDSRDVSLGYVGEQG